MSSKTEEQVEQLEELDGQPETGGEQLELDFRLVMVEILGREATFRCQVCEIDDVKSLSQIFDFA